MKQAFLLDIIFKGGKEHPDQLYARVKESDHNTYGVFPKDGTQRAMPHTITDLPSYLRIEPEGSLARYGSLDSPLYPGFLIDLSRYGSLEEYIKAHFPTTKRMFRRQDERLHREVDANSKVHWQSPMEEGELDLVFERLEKFLSTRFAQKETENYELPLLPRYKAMFRELVPKGEAIVFVRQDGDSPIGIGIGFLQDTTLHLFNVAFDPTYGRYGLGNALILDALAWCFKYGIDRVDMGRGDFIHKRKWINGSYTYREIQLYPKGDLFATAGATTRWAANSLRYHAIVLLKKMGAVQVARAFLLWKYRRKQAKTKNATYEH